MMVHIHFEPKDRQTFQFRKTTNKLASFLIKNNEYLRPFVHFLRDSHAYDANKFHQTIRRYQERVSRKRVRSGFDEEYEMSVFPDNPMLAQSYVPWQYMDKTFRPEIGLKMGTIFPELVSPYTPCQSMRTNEFLETTNQIGEGCNNGR